MSNLYFEIPTTGKALDVHRGDKVMGLEVHGVSAGLYQASMYEDSYSTEPTVDLTFAGMSGGIKLDGNTIIEFTRMVEVPEDRWFWAKNGTRFVKVPQTDKFVQVKVNYGSETVEDVTSLVDFEEVQEYINDHGYDATRVI